MGLVDVDGLIPDWCWFRDVLQSSWCWLALLLSRIKMFQCLFKSLVTRGDTEQLLFKLCLLRKYFALANLWYKNLSSLILYLHHHHRILRSIIILMPVHMCDVWRDQVWRNKSRRDCHDNKSRIHDQLWFTPENVSQDSHKSCDNDSHLRHSFLIWFSLAMTRCQNYVNTLVICLLPLWGYGAKFHF